MAEPASLREYTERFHRNTAITGYGLNVMSHTPCPFCAAAEWTVFPVINSRPAMARGATCKECGRSAKAIFTDPPGGGVQFEVVQTGGPDQPAWLEPKMRRV